MKEAFLEALPLLEEIEQAGYEAYFVGGAVRDYIAGRPSSDVDIATSATPDELKKIFPKTVDVGIEHGTVLVLYKGSSYEITTFRTEGTYSDRRRPDEVSFVRSLREDLKRRDFTMNAIAMDRRFTILDPFAGRKAIEERMICAVGNPDERFNEDALRMMRALRFVSQLGFTPGADVLRSVRDHGALIKEVSVERIYAEFDKLLAGSGRLEALSLLVSTGLNKYLPGLAEAGPGMGRMCSLPAGRLEETSELWALLIYLIRPKDAQAFLRSWKMSRQKMKEILHILQLLTFKPDFKEDPFTLFQAGMPLSIKAAHIQAVLDQQLPEHAAAVIEKRFAGFPIADFRELALSGKELSEMAGRPPGPWIKEALDEALKAVLTLQAKNNGPELKEWLKRCKQI